MKITNFSIVNGILTFLLIFIGFPIFVETFGYLLFGNNNKDHEYYILSSKLVYMASSIMGQIGYSLATKLDSGFLIFPIFDCSNIISEIHFKAIEKNEKGFINTLVALFISTILTCLISFLCSVFKLGHYLYYVPFNIIIVITITTGINFLLFSFTLFWTKNIFMSLLFISISFLITFGNIFLKNYTKNPKSSIFYIIFILFITNLIKNNYTKEFLKNHKLIPSNIIEKFSIKDFFKKIYFNEIDFIFLIESIFLILSISIFPIISFISSFYSYCEVLEINYSINRELKSLSFANFLSAFTFCPTYFNFSGSVFFSMLGVNSPIYSFIAGLSMIYYYFFSHLIQSMFSTFINSMLTEEIAIMILTKYTKLCFQFSFLDNFIIIFLIIIYLTILKNDIFKFMIIAFFINFFISYFKTGKLYSENNIKEIKTEKGIILKVENRLDFCNISYLVNILKKFENSEIIIDLLDCYYIDLTSNFIFLRLKKSGFNIKFKNYKKNYQNNFYFWLF